MRLSVCSAFAMLFMGTAASMDQDPVFVGVTQKATKGGSNLPIVWMIDTNVTSPDPNVSTGVLRLGRYSSSCQAQMLIANLDSAALKLEKYSWTVPTTLTTSDTYCVLLEYGDISYPSNQFYLENENTNATGSNAGKGSGAIQMSTIFLSTIPALVMATVNHHFL